MGLPWTRAVASTVQRSMEPAVQGFEFFDDAVYECKELCPSGMRVFGDESGGMLGEQVLPGHARPPAYFPVRDESQPTEIIGAAGVMQAPEYVLEVQAETLLSERFHVAVQHGRPCFRLADSFAAHGDHLDP